MTPSSMLSELQTGAYTTVLMVSVTQPPTMVLFYTTKPELCVCLEHYEHQKADAHEMYHCSTSYRNFSFITGLLPDALSLPQNKMVH